MIWQRDEEKSFSLKRKINDKYIFNLWLKRKFFLSLSVNSLIRMRMREQSSISTTQIRDNDINQTKWHFEQAVKQEKRFEYQNKAKFRDQNRDHFIIQGPKWGFGLLYIYVCRFSKHHPLLHCFWIWCYSKF